MVNFLSDPIWQLIGYLAGPLTLVVSVYAFWLQHNNKSLSYSIVTNTHFISAIEPIPDMVRELYEEEIFQNLHLVTLKIANDGTMPIRPDHFERPLSFDFGNRAKLLRVSVTDTFPDNLTPHMMIREHRISLLPMLLNSRDSILISMFILRFDEEFCVDGRIEGVEKIKDDITLPTVPAVKALKTILLLLFIILTPVFTVSTSYWWIAFGIILAFLIRTVDIPNDTPKFIIDQIEKIIMPSNEYSVIYSPKEFGILIK